MANVEKDQTRLREMKTAAFEGVGVWGIYGPHFFPKYPINVSYMGGNLAVEDHGLLDLRLC